MVRRVGVLRPVVLRTNEARVRQARRRWLAQGAAGLLAPTLAWTQMAPPARQVGVLALTQDYTRFDEWRAFADEMARRGYVATRDVEYVHRSPGADTEPELSRRLLQSAQDLVRLKVDLIYIVEGEVALRSARSAMQTVPIVVDRFNFDPVEAGFITSLGRPGGNVTGNAVLFLDLESKAVEVLLQAIGSVPSVGYIDPGYVQTWRMFPSVLERRRALGRALGFAPVFDAIERFEQLDAALKRLSRAGVRAVKFDDPPFFADRRADVAAAFSARHLAAVSTEPAYARAGLMMAFGWDVDDVARRSARYVDGILRGVRPQDLPVEQVSKFKLAINLSTARTIGVRITPAILARADEVFG